MDHGMILIFMMSSLLTHACKTTRKKNFEHIHDYTCTYNGVTYENGQVVPVARLLITRDPCWVCKCRNGILTVCTNETCPVRKVSRRLT